MKLYYLPLLAFTLICCGTPLLSYSGGDGSSVEYAVIVKGAKTEMAGVAAERVWIEEHFPDGFKKGKQALLSSGGKHYDQIEITTHDGRKKTIYFDITGFYGKF